MAKQNDKDISNEELAEMVARGFENVDKRFDGVDKKLDDVETRLTLVERKVDKAMYLDSQRVDKLEKQVKTIQEKLGIAQN